MAITHFNPEIIKLVIQGIPIFITEKMVGQDVFIKGVG
jgi:hypothetical protein